MQRILLPCFSVVLFTLVLAWASLWANLWLAMKLQPFYTYPWFCGSFAVVAGTPVAVVLLAVWPRFRKLGWKGFAPLSVCCLYIIVLFFAPVVGACWVGSQYPETQRRGNEVVAALDAYYAAHGRYPAQLDDLRPAYLSRAPTYSYGSFTANLGYKLGEPGIPRDYPASVLIGFVTTAGVRIGMVVVPPPVIPTPWPNHLREWTSGS